MTVKEIVEIFKGEYKEEIESWADGVNDDFDLDILFEIKETYVPSKKANNLLIIWNLFLYPAVILHELTHLFVAIIFFQKPRKFYVSSPFYTNLSGYVEGNKLNINLGSYLTSLAPLLIIAMAIVLPFINFYFFIFTAYTILTLKWSIPSKRDIYNVILYKYSKKFPDMIYLIIDRVYQNVSLTDLLQEEGVNYIPNFITEFLDNDYTVLYKKISNY